MHHKELLDSEKPSENAEKAISAPASDTGAASKDTPHDHVVAPKTAGLKIHNEVTYRGIDWLLNSSIGVAFCYWQARTHSGEKFFNKPVSSFFKTILKPVFKTPQGLEEGSKWGTMFTGIMAGGTLIIPPMMLMENRNVKKKVVRQLDEMMYGKDEVADNPEFKKCYESIDKEPEKTFSTGMIARLMAITPLIAASSTPAINMRLMKYIYDPIGNLSERAASAVGIKPSAEMLEKGAMELLDGNPKSIPQFQNNWDFLHRTIGFDFGLTIVYSFLHELAYKSLAAIGMKKDTDDQRPEGLLHMSTGINDFGQEINVIEDKVEESQHAEKIKKRSRRESFQPMESHTQKTLNNEQPVFAR